MSHDANENERFSKGEVMIILPKRYFYENEEEEGGPIIYNSLNMMRLVIQRSYISNYDYGSLLL